MGILGIDLNNITFDDNYHQHDPKTIIQVRVLAWHIKCEKPKALKKRLNRELTLIVWHPCPSAMSEDEKKEIEPIFN